MISDQDFYQGYIYDYYVYKIITLKEILLNKDKFYEEYLSKSINGYKSEDYSRVIKSEIRQTYFHSIETLFELIFAIYDFEKNDFFDFDIFFRLSNSNMKKNYSRINDFSKKVDSLDFLNKKTLNSQGKEIEIGRHLFYFGLDENSKIDNNIFEDIPKSIDAIKKGLKIIATDFSDRNEYNSYKHSLRIVPILKKFVIAKTEDMSVLKEWDLSESMSFLLRSKDLNNIKIVTKIFDFERDLCLTMFCSNLISNIILLRKASLRLKMDTQLNIAIFGLEQIQNCAKLNVPLQNLIHDLKKGIN